MTKKQIKKGTQSFVVFVLIALSALLVLYRSAFGDFNSSTANSGSRLINKSSSPVFRIVQPSSLPPSWRPRISSVTDAMEFIEKRHPQVEGWFMPHAMYSVLILMRLQLMAGVGGAIGEIGVHYGKLTSFLAYFAREDDINRRQLFAADLFEGMQELNVDNSGSGNRDKFTEALLLSGSTIEDHFVLSVGPSQKIKSPGYFIKNNLAPFRFFSVDGGHTYETALADMFTIEQHITEGGIVMLDDFLRVDWWGVTEAAYEYKKRGGKLVPFAFVANKLFYTTESHHEFYYHGIDSNPVVCSSHRDPEEGDRFVSLAFGSLAWCSKTNWVQQTEVSHEDWEKAVKDLLEYFD
jgi:Methyltransferase domain